MSFTQLRPQEQCMADFYIEFNHVSQFEGVHLPCWNIRSRVRVIPSVRRAGPEADVCYEVNSWVDAHSTLEEESRYPLIIPCIGHPLEQQPVEDSLEVVTFERIRNEIKPLLRASNARIALKIAVVFTPRTSPRRPSPDLRKADECVVMILGRRYMQAVIAGNAHDLRTRLIAVKKLCAVRKE